jgi:Winged helix DNA-binding domain
MKDIDIAKFRLYNQKIAASTFTKPSEVVHWLGAMQAQDYASSLWAIGLRMQNATETMIEQAIAAKTIVRTWPMRGTLHFVAGEDIRWIFNLMKPRLDKLVESAIRYNRLQTDAATFVKSNAVIIKALEGGNQLTREELATALKQADVNSDEFRLSYLLQKAIVDGLICYGVRRGKQFTFVLLDEWVTTARKLEREEALAEFALRYFTSHGPATLLDYVWWSGLTMTEAKTGLELIKSQLEEIVSNDTVYWCSRQMPDPKTAESTAFLLPSFDEYLIAYRDRSMIVDPTYAKQVITKNGIFYPIMVKDGQIIGSWKRVVKKGKLIITPSLAENYKDAEISDFATAAEHYGQFMTLPVEMTSIHE